MPCIAFDISITLFTTDANKNNKMKRNVDLENRWTVSAYCR
jgi:hypothetical protein